MQPGDCTEKNWPVFLRYCWQGLPVCYHPCPPHRTGPLYRTGPMLCKGKRYFARVNAVGKGKRCHRVTVLRKTGLRPVFLRYCWQVLPVCYLPWTPHRTGPLYRTGPMVGKGKRYFARVNAVGKGKRCNRATVLRKTGLRPVFLRYCWQVLPVCYPTVDPT